MIVKRFVTGSLEVNCYLVGDEISRKALIIDPGYYNPALTSFAKEEGYHVQWIILTHGHGDHMCAVPSYQKKYPGIHVTAHIEDRDLLNGRILNFSNEILGRELSIEADEYLEEDQTRNFGELRLSFLHTPGHTGGSMSVLINDYLFSGDTLFYEAVGRTDFPGGSTQMLMNSIREKLLVLPDDTIVMPGHMADTTIGYEKEHNPFLRERA